MQTAREMAREMEYEPGLQWLSGLQAINHHTLSDFVSQGGSPVQKLFVELLAMLEKAELISLERVMHDGTKVRAQASSDSFHREKSVREHLERARQVVEAAEQAEKTGVSRRSQAARLRAARERAARVEQALQEMAALRAESETPEKVRVSVSDPEARNMKQSDGGFAPSFNVQISTEASHTIIVSADVTPDHCDYQQLQPAVDRIEQNFGKKPSQMVIDGGYSSQANIVAAEAQGLDLIGSLGDEEARSRAAMKRLGIDPEFRPAMFRANADASELECPAGTRLVYIGISQTHGYEYRQYRAAKGVCATCAFQTKCCPRKPEKGRLVSVVCEPAAVIAFREKMKTEAARKIYRQRSQVAETPHAWIKTKFGIRQFRLRGLFKVRSEALWACLTYNILQWIRLEWRPGLVAA
jgi:hypothetical protein